MKTIYRKEYRRLIARLVAKREEKKLSQEEVAGRLGTSQPTLCKIEACQRRLDFIEMLDYLDAIGGSLEDVMTELEERGWVHTPTRWDSTTR